MKNGPFKMKGFSGFKDDSQVNEKVQIKFLQKQQVLVVRL